MSSAMIVCEGLKNRLFLTSVAMFWFCTITAAAHPVSKCYAMDRNNYLYDFTDKVGKEMEFNGQGSDLVVRFCRDVQNRSQSGYVNYGRFAPENLFTNGSSEVDFIQFYRYGDLIHCEHNGYELMGRETKVNIICARCADGAPCKDDFGCICNVSYDHTLCRAEVVVAINCTGHTPRIVPGFTIGFSARGGEVVDNGITQWGFFKDFYDYSFVTNQRSVFLYFTSISSLSSNVGRPSFQVNPAKGLSVELLGTAASGVPPTTETPTILEVKWQCNIAREDPYVVKITVPVKGYDPVIFFLGKLCASQEKSAIGGRSGWETFGVLICVLMVLLVVFCCIGIFYKTKVEHKHGLEVLPGLGFVNDCLRRTRDKRRLYNSMEEFSDVIGDHSTWNRVSVSSHGTSRLGFKYGTFLIVGSSIILM